MEDKDTGRLEAFSDGVFAVAITLLVLNIKIPSQILADKDLWPLLSSQWPMLVAYITSFATVGIMWINHNRLFQQIKHADTGLHLLNLLLLLSIVILPVPTALSAEYLIRLDQHAAAIIYCETFFLMSCSFDLLWYYAAHHNRLLGKDTDKHEVMAISQQYLFGPLGYSIAFGIAWINTPICIIFCFFLALFFALPARSPRSLSANRDSIHVSQEQR
jgi:uncharacterized membrane protein